MERSWHALAAEAILIATLLTAVSTGVGMLAGAAPPGELEFGAVFTSYACTYLCVVQSRSNYLWGAVSCALYAALFVSYGLQASATVNVYLLGCMIYGWWRWGPDPVTRPVRHVQLRMIPVYLAFTVVVWISALATVQALGGVVPPWDASILALTILAQLLLDNKRIETWVVWIFVNVIAIVVYADQGLHLVVAQYVFFLGNAIVAWFVWQRDMRRRSQVTYTRLSDTISPAVFADYGELESRVAAAHGLAALGTDPHQERADREGISREEARRRNHADAYALESGITRRTT